MCVSKSATCPSSSLFSSSLFLSLLLSVDIKLQLTFLFA